MLAGVVDSTYAAGDVSGNTAFAGVACHPQSPAFSAPTHRDQHHSRPSRYRRRPRRHARRALPAAHARTDIARDALLAAALELSGVLAEFIRHGLRAKAPLMLAGIAALASSHLPTSFPRSHLPAALSVPLRASLTPSRTPRTHSPLRRPQKAKEGSATRRTPSFPRTRWCWARTARRCRTCRPAPPRAPRTASAMLPVLPLMLPSPHAFAILHARPACPRLAPLRLLL
ncbi:hypothetical protein DFH09DRAFT_1362185 [Mycena vulgaris]|nr:hypothetical protein DFH09DRAFT_1362185 [Mycena vulgaris]